MEAYTGDSPQGTHGEPHQARADKAAVWCLWLSLASVALFGLSVWLVDYLGNVSCGVGAILWAVTWAVGLALAVIALRGADSSAAPDRVRRLANIGLIVSAANLMLVVGFLISLYRAAQQL